MEPYGARRRSWPLTRQQKIVRVIDLYEAENAYMRHQIDQMGHTAPRTLETRAHWRIDVLVSLVLIIALVLAWAMQPVIEHSTSPTVAQGWSSDLFELPEIKPHMDLHTIPDAVKRRCVSLHNRCENLIAMHSEQDPISLDLYDVLDAGSAPVISHDANLQPLEDKPQILCFDREDTERVRLPGFDYQSWVEPERYRVHTAIHEDTHGGDAANQTSQEQLLAAIAGAKIGNVDYILQNDAHNDSIAEETFDLAEELGYWWTCTITSLPFASGIQGGPFLRNCAALIIGCVACLMVSFGLHCRRQAEPSPQADESGIEPVDGSYIDKRQPSIDPIHDNDLQLPLTPLRTGKENDAPISRKRKPSESSEVTSSPTTSKRRRLSYKQACPGYSG